MNTPVGTMTGATDRHELGGDRPKPFPETSFRDLLRLVKLQRQSKKSGDTVEGVTRWAAEMADRHGSASVIVKVGSRKILLVNDESLSRQILGARPEISRCPASPMKVDAMSYLAEGALVIAHDEEWDRLRAFNEDVLGTNRVHDDAGEFVKRVDEAFAEPIHSTDDLRAAMGRTMGGIVFGKGVAPASLAEDVDTLIGVVQSPLKRKLLGYFYRGRVERFRNQLRDQMARSSASGPSLMKRAIEHAPEGVDTDTLLDQVPHWMFTFTGSGTELLSRTLAMILSREDVHRRVASEARGGAYKDPLALSQMDYLEACIMETGRLFPPVTKTLHRASRAIEWGGFEIPAGTDIVHYTALFHRHGDDPQSLSFRPADRLAATDKDYSLLFLSGSRACPGKDLILMVIKSAIAKQIDTFAMAPRRTRLSSDPLPAVFPGEAAQWQ